MLSEDNDKFELTKHIQPKKNDNDLEISSSNFFMSGNFNDNAISRKSNSYRKLNDLDSNLLEEDAYKEVDDELLKLEYRISKYEDEIKLIDNQIMSANVINDSDLIGELSGRRLIILSELEKLKLKYSKKSVTGRVTDGFGRKIRNFRIKFKDFFQAYTDALLSKLPQKIVSTIELKESLQKLENINRSVDDLISSNSSYGEYNNKYEQLSKYIIKANSIQAKISKNFKG